MRRLLCHEPRGHADMYGCFLVPPDDEGAELGVLFWHKDGYSTACGHGTIALGAWAVESGRVEAPGDGVAEIAIDVPSGRVVAAVRTRGGAVEAVAFRNVPSYVVARDVPAGRRRRRRRVRRCALRVGPGRAPRACGSTPAQLTQLIDAGRAVKHALDGHGRRAARRPAPVAASTGRSSGRRPARCTSATSRSSPTARSTGRRAARARRRASRCWRTRARSARATCSRHDSIVDTTFRARIVGETRRGRPHRGRGHRVPHGRAPLRARRARPARHRVRAALSRTLGNRHGEAWHHEDSPILQRKAC